MSLLVTTTLKGVLPAMVVSGVVFFVLGRLWRRGGEECGGVEWASSPGLALGLFAGYVGLRGWPGFPPAESTSRLIYLAVVAIPFAWLDAATIRPTAIRRAGRVVLSAILVVGLLFTQFGSWGFAVALVGIAGLVLLFVAIWGGVSGLISRESDNRSFAWILCLASAGGGVVLSLSGSLLLAQVSWVLAAAIAVQGAIALVKPVKHWACGAVPICVVSLLGIWLAGYVFAELHPISGLFLTAGLVAPWIVARKASQKRGLAALGIRAAPVLGCLVGAVIVAYYTSPPLVY